MIEILKKKKTGEERERNGGRRKLERKIERKIER